MKFTTLLCALVGCLALLGCEERASGRASANGASQSPIRVGLNPQFPPMEYKNADGEIVGYTADFVEALEKELGQEMVLRNTPWDGIFGALDAGQIDLIISSATITPERQQRYLFSDPYVNAGQVLVVRKEDGEKYKTLQDLQGKTVGATVGTTSYLRLQEDKDVFSEIRAFDTAPLGFQALLSGTIDGYMIDSPVAAYWATRQPESAGRVVFSDEMYTEEEFGIVARKDQQELVDRLNEALEALREDGTMERLRAKWLSSDASAADSDAEAAPAP